MAAEIKVKTRTELTPDGDGDTRNDCQAGGLGSIDRVKIPGCKRKAVGEAYAKQGFMFGDPVRFCENSACQDAAKDRVDQIYRASRSGARM